MNQYFQALSGDLAFEAKGVDAIALFVFSLLSLSLSRLSGPLGVWPMA
jgi:hypothetical protein